MFYKDPESAAKSILGQKEAPEEKNQEGIQEPKNESDMEGLHSASKDMIDAFHNKDHEALTTAMDSFIEQCQSRKDMASAQDQDQEAQSDRLGEED